MLAIIICSHSNFSEGLINAAEMICGPLEKISAITLQEDGSLESLMDEVREVYEEHNAQGDKVVCLTDLEHATPYNACVAALSDTDAKVISGMSLPLLLEIVLSRNATDDYDSLLENSIISSKNNIHLTIPKQIVTED